MAVLISRINKSIPCSSLQEIIVNNIQEARNRVYNLFIPDTSTVVPILLSTSPPFPSPFCRGIPYRPLEARRFKMAGSCHLRTCASAIELPSSRTIGRPLVSFLVVKERD